MNKKALTILLLLSLLIGLFGLAFHVSNVKARERLQLSGNPSEIRVALYNGSGAWYYSALAMERMFEWMDCAVTTVQHDDITSGCLDDFDVLAWPGGHYPAYWEAGPEGKSKIQEFISDGGGYIGICAGAWWASDYMVWMADPDYPPPEYKVEGDEENLDLFPGVARGPIEEITPFNTGTMTRINIVDHTHPIANCIPDHMQILYMGGPHLLPYEGAEVAILGRYDVTGTPAIVAFEYGDGRVFLCGPHPEIEEDTGRDGCPPDPEGTVWARAKTQWSDEGSDWPLLLEAMKWLTNASFPCMHAVSVDIKPGSWPNPLQLKGKGVLPVAICGTEDFDVTTIDPETIQLTLEGAAEGVSPLRWSYEDAATPYMGEPCGGHDLEGDGYLDLTLKFKAQEVIGTLGLDAFYHGDAVMFILTGNLKAELGGTPIHGQDCVVVLSQVARPFTVIGPWSEGEMAAFLPVLQAFEERTGIEVVYKTYQAYELANMLPTAFAAGTTPGDVIFMWSWFIREQGQEGHIHEVTDLIDEDDFAPGALDPVTVNDVLYGGVYTGKAKPGFWYRRSFFSDHGLMPPTTWDEFVTLLSDITAIPGIESPIASGDLVGWPLSDVVEHFLITFGGPQLHRDLIAGTVSWTDPPVRSIFADRLVPLLDAGYFSDPKEWTLALEEWWNEQHGLYFMGSWITAMVDAPADLRLFPLPDAEGLVFAADFFCIPTYTDYLEEAEELFRFLASGEAQSIQVAQGGHIATNVDVPLDAYPPVDRQVAEILEGKELLTDLDDTIGGDFQTTFWGQLKLLWIDPTTLDEVLAALEAVSP